MNPYFATLLLSLTAQAAIADGLVDPTRPVHVKDAATREAVQSLRLEAILRADDRLLAIVNGKIVREGDRIGNARIDAIGHDAVHYSRGGRSEIVRLADKSMAVRKNVTAHEDET